MQKLSIILSLILGFHFASAETLNNSKAIVEGHIVAQDEGLDAYDPFVDYSEFDEASDEEEDINFFRNGRFFTLGLTIGNRFVTEGMRQVYDDALGFGLFLSYFFDLRFALQFTFLTASHDINFTSGGTTVSGDATIRQFGIGMKYFFNTQNVTRGLAQFNPYLLIGLSQVSREAGVTTETAFSKESAMGFDIATGVEFPIMRNKMYLGGQLGYTLVNFDNENTEIVLAGPINTGIHPTGDFWTALAVMGINF